MPVLPSVTATNETRTASHKSETVTMLPLVGCLVEAEKVIGPDRPWNAINGLQQTFLANFFSLGRNDVGRIPELEATASWNVEDVNKFLRDRGFSIELPAIGKGSFAVASVLNVLVEWIAKGEATTIRDKKYPAVKLEKRNMLHYYTSRSNSHPIVQIPTKSGDQVCMTVVDNPPTGFDLVKLAQELNKTSLPNAHFENVIFPMVDYDREIDIKWIVGMNTKDAKGLGWEIANALQQTKFKMNEYGARVKSAAAMEMLCMGVREPKPDLVIDQPFLIWITRDGLSQPLFTGFIAEDCWKNPGNLS